MAAGEVEIKVTADASAAKKEIEGVAEAAKSAGEKVSQGGDAGAKGLDKVGTSAKSAGEKVDEQSERGKKALEAIGYSAEETGSKLGANSEVGKKALEKIGEAGAAVGKAVVAGGAVAGAAVVGIGKAALDSYASYEQLVGGVDTLFGSASGKLQGYASDAYRTAGMSANQYMEQATSFSASLVQGLKEDGRSMEEVYSMAADSANTAMTDMADNVNKMGSSMTDVQNAYQGFAKDNYTMLDNLKLGYGGTQAEMARLINDSGVLGDTVVTANTVSSVSFDKIIEAIHVTQERMGITGTTAKEAMGTIEGSINLTKAAWDNWLTGLADPNADMGALTDKLLEGLGAVAQNVAPRVAEIGQSIIDHLPGALSGAADVLGPVLSEALSTAWNGAVAVLGQAGIQLPEIDASQITDALNGVKGALQWFADNGSTIATVLGSIAAGFATMTVVQTLSGPIAAISGAFSILMTSLQNVGLVTTLADGFKLLGSAMPVGPVGIIISLVAALVAGLVILWDTNEDFRNAVTGAWEAIQGAFSTAVEAIGGFFSGIGETLSGAAQTVADTLSGVGQAIVSFFTETVPQAFQSLADWFLNLPATIAGALSAFVATIAAWAVSLGQQAMLAGQQFVSNLGSFLSQLPYNVGYFLGSVIGTVIAWVANMASNALSAGQQFLTNVVNFMMQLPGNVWNFLTTTISNVITWVSQMGQKAQEAGSRFLSNVASFLSQLPGRVWSFLTQAISKAISFASQMGQKATEAGSKFLSNVANAIQGLPGKVWGFLSEAIGKAASFVSDFAGKATSAATDFSNNLINGIKGIPGKVASIGGDIVRGIGNGIRDAAGNLKGALSSVVDGAIQGVKDKLGIHSPSRLFRDEVGVMITRGAAEGVERGAAAFREAVDAALAYVPEVDVAPDVDVTGGSVAATMATDVGPLAEAVRGVSDRIGQLEDALGGIIARNAPQFPSSREMGRLTRGWVNGAA